MKLVYILFLSTIFIACSNQTDNTPSDSETNSEEISENIFTYPLVVDKSKAEWARTLDQKPTKQKVKLFGKMVDVELGEVKLNTNGSVAIKEGELIYKNEKIESAHVVFDMASFKFSEEKDNGLFDVTNFPNSTLKIHHFEQDSVGYKALGDLTIQDITNQVDILMELTSENNSKTLNGSFTVNTLDFPLREKVTEKDINKDEIKIDFNLNYLVENN